MTTENETTHKAGDPQPWELKRRDDLAEKVPPHTLDALRKYRDCGYPVGHFLSAMMANDLRGACNRADDENAPAICDIFRWIYNRMPTAAWGTYEDVIAWVHDDTQIRTKIMGEHGERWST